MAGACGVISFTPAAGAGDYFAYYLPHRQFGGGAGVHFQWFNCSDPSHGRTCVLDNPGRGYPAVTGSAALGCDAVDVTAAAVAVALENRPNPTGENDYTPSNEPFHGYTKMEMAAVPSERATIPAGMAVFMEPREHAIRTPPSHTHT